MKFNDLGKSKKIFLLVAGIVAVGCLLLLLPFVQSAILLFTEKNVLHRGLQRPEKWISIIKKIAYIIAFYSICLFLYIKYEAIIIDVMNSSFVGIRFVLGIMICLPIIWIFLFAIHYSTNVLLMDSLETVRLFKKFTEGNLAFKDLFAQHNEHRMFFPKVIFLFIADVFNLNNKSLVAVNVMFLLCAYVLLLYRHLKIFCEELNIKMFFQILALGFLTLNGISYGDILWGFQIAWLLIVLCVVASLFFMEKYFSTNKYNFLIISLLFAIISSFSSMHGLWIWLVYFVIFFSLSLRGKEYCIKIKNWISVFGLGLFCFLFYFHNYNKPAYHPEYFGTGLLPTIQYFFTAKGAIFTSELPTLAFVLGVLIFIIDIFVMLNWFLYKEGKQKVLAIGLILFGNAFLASISIGRSNLGIAQALSDRYVLNTLFGFIGLALYFLQTHRRNSLYTVMRYIVFMFIFTLIGRNFYLIKADVYHDYKQIEEYKRNIVLNYKTAEFEDLKMIYPWNSLDEAHILLSFMENRKLGSFCDLKQ